MVGDEYRCRRITFDAKVFQACLNHRRPRPRLPGDGDRHCQPGLAQAGAYTGGHGRQCRDDGAFLVHHTEE